MASPPPPQFGTLIPDGSVPMEEPMRPLPASFSSSSSSSPSSSSSFSPSLLIIAAILAFVILSSASIYLLIRLFSRPSSSASASTRVSHSDSISSSGDNGAAAAASSGSDERDKADLIINSLPLFTLASSLAAVPKSSPDCAVCLSPFEPHADLRLLPACRHAFHAQCIDTWLRSTPSCPLCRASISLPVPPPPPPLPQHPEDPSSAAGSGSFRVEIGSISRRRTPSSSDIETLAPPPHLRSYSIGSFDYLVEEEVEAVVSRIARRTKEKAPPPSAPPAPYIAAPPGEDVAEAAGGRGGGGRGSWLRDYVDRITSSASSSFNSLRFSGRWSARWSHRFDDGGGGGGGGGGGADSWWLDMEANNQLQREPEEPAYYAFYRWLVGV